MIRLVELIIVFVLLLICIPVFIVLSVLGYIDTGSPIFIQRRITKNKKEFSLIKFRTMKLSTKSVGTHLVNPNSITRFGGFLRKTKLDELPQLWNVLIGDMSLVGPRPNLPNQIELLKCREEYGVYKIKAGITGLSQIRGIDMSDPEKLAKSDAEMISTFSTRKYFKYLFLTIIGKGQGDKVIK